MADEPINVGDRFDAMGLLAVVNRLTRKYAYLDVYQSHGPRWVKRQPLPLPDTWRRL